MSSRATLVLVLTLILALFLAGAAWGEAPAGESGCLRCHRGIEAISENPVMAGLPCFACHLGNPGAATMEAAHRGMFANPSDYRVVDETCGSCHPREVSNSRKSLHATSAGEISGTRYLWGAQDTMNPIYSNYDVQDSDGEVPSGRGALISLEGLPLYDPKKPVSATNHPVDDLLRGRCLRCHLWSRGAERDGDWRASGCAACHVVYNDSGTYEGADGAIPKGQKGRPARHRLTALIPVSQCLHCHNRGARTGVSYAGLVESAPEEGGGALHGRRYSRLTADVHYQRGMLCIDCHTERDLHGDGNIYGKMEDAVEIECEDCHGTAEFYSTLKTSRGNPLPGLMEKEGGIAMVFKADGRERPVPQTNDAITNGTSLAATAMGIPGHMKKLECYACHARWAPQCYGCHAEEDLGRRAGDWINTKSPADPSKAGSEAERQMTAHAWGEDLSYLRWESPALGMNSEGRVSPFIPGGQAVFTQLGPDGKAAIDGKVFRTFDGLPGIAHNPVQPHTVSSQARSCEDCHASGKAVGLGAGIYNSTANGFNVPFGLDRVVDEKGKRLQASTHPGARPFNRAELDRVLRVGVCVSCHGAQRDAYIWKKVTDVTGFAATDARHREIINRLFEEGTRRLERLWQQQPSEAPPAVERRK